MKRERHRERERVREEKERGIERVCVMSTFW